MNTYLSKWIYLPVMLCIILLASCQADPWLTGEEDPDTGTLTLEVSLPVYSLPSTRAGITMEDETKITTMFALIFSESGDKYLGYQKIDVASITSSGTHGERKRFKLKPISQTGNIYISLVANIEESKLSSSGLTINIDTRTTIQRKLTGTWTQRPETTGNWKGIPMWGNSVTFSATSTSALPTIYLIRSLAKVEISISDSPSFKLKNIYLCNIAQNFQVIPHPDYLDDVDMKITAPSLPTSSTKTSIFNPPYTYTQGEAIVLFLPEAEKFGGDFTNEWEKTFCFVAKGDYTMEDGTTKELFYRIDMRDTNANYIDILRNHVYYLRLSVPQYPGKEKIEDALKDSNLFMGGSVTCDEPDILYMQYAGGYMLGVSRLDFHRGHQKSTITIANANRTLEEKEEHPETYLKVSFEKPAGSPEVWNYRFLNGTNIHKGNEWIRASKEGTPATIEGVKLELVPFTPSTAGAFEVRTATLRVYALNELLYHDITITQYTQEFFVPYRHRDHKKYWLVNHEPGTGIVIRPATPWRAMLRSDDDNLVKEICTTTGEIAGERDIFFIRTINGWNGTEDGKQRRMITYDDSRQVTYRLQSTLDPAFYWDETLEFFGLMERQGYYITPSSPMSPHFVHDIHGKHTGTNQSWYYAMNMYDALTPSKIGQPRPDGEETGCPSFGNGPGGDPWRLPSQEEIKLVWQFNNPDESKTLYGDKTINFWQTNTEVEDTPVYRSFNHWLCEDRSYSYLDYEDHFGSVYWTTVQESDQAFPVSMHIDPKKPVEELTRVFIWDFGIRKTGTLYTGGKDYNGREYFCITKTNK